MWSYFCKVTFLWSDHVHFHLLTVCYGDGWIANKCHLILYTHTIWVCTSWCTDGGCLRPYVQFLFYHSCDLPFFFLSLFWYKICISVIFLPFPSLSLLLMFSLKYYVEDYGLGFFFSNFSFEEIRKQRNLPFSFVILCIFEKLVKFRFSSLRII